MSALAAPAANDPSAVVVQLRPSRFVTIELAETVTGFSQAAIRTKISRGVWLENRQWVRREGRILIDLEGYERWAATGVA